MNYIRTAGGLHLVLKGNIVALASSDPLYAKVVQAISVHATEDEVQAILDEEKRQLDAAARVAKDIVLKDETLYFRDEPIVGTVGLRMLQCLREGFDLSPFSAFLDKLSRNPSNRVVTRLYDFLEVGKNAITPEGNFLAFKAVRADWRDIHSGTFDNSVGREVSMPRNRVNDDDDMTCSHGLHVCSFDYLPHFSHANGHVVICEVDPADVVSIPKDYNDTKMRVCRYKVVGEFEGYYQGQGNLLAHTSVRGDEDEPFVLELLTEPDGAWTEEATYARLSEGAHALEDAFSDMPNSYAARLLNRVTGAVIDEKTNSEYSSDNPLDDSGGYSIVGLDKQGIVTDLTNGHYFETMADAVEPALAHVRKFAQVEIRDPDGQVALTVS